MQVPSWILAGVARLHARRWRRILVACVATLAIGVGLCGTVLFVRWRAERAVQGDTRVVAGQAAQQLLRAFHSRRGTLTLLRDTLDKAPNLQPDERQALAKSAVNHTRHLLGVGLVRAGQTLGWWDTPSPTTAQ